ncbi:MAG: hypothetical protein QXH42_05020 [Thermoplasmata archaeon]
MVELKKGSWLRVVLWCIPLISIGDVIWAVSTRMGVALTFGLGLYKLDSIHILIQVALMVALSLIFISASPCEGEEHGGARGENAGKKAKGRMR